MPQITLAEFADVARSWAQTEDLALLVVRPEETDVAGADDELGTALLTQLQTAHTLAVEPYADDVGDVPLLANLPEPGTITAEEQIESIDAVKWTLSNGITVIAKQTDFRDDEVLFRAFSPGGHSLVSRRTEHHVSAVPTPHSSSTGSGVGPPRQRRPWINCSQARGFRCPPTLRELFEGLQRKRLS